MNIDNKQRTQLAVALGAVVALVIGFSAFGKSDATSNKTALRGQMGGPPGQMQGGGPTGGAGGQSGSGQGGPGQNGRGQGAPGQGGPGGRQMPKQVTGTAAKKAKAAALEAVEGTARAVMENPRGEGYVVIVKTDDGPVLVELDADFKVTGKHELPGRPGQGDLGRGGPGGPPGMHDDQSGDAQSQDGNVQ